MILRKAFSGALRVQLYTQFLNKINRWYVEALKVTTIGAAITHGYIGIRFGHSNPIVPLFCAFIHFACFTAYCGVFQRAHRLRDMQKVLKRKILTASGRCKNRCFRSEMLKATAALQCKGLQVGSFHEMERNSALNYIDFVERQLMSLLIAF